MQRPPTGTGTPPMATPSPLATTGNTGHYVPGPVLAPGQVLAPPPVARNWPTLPELYHALKRRLVLATFLGLLVGMGSAGAVWLALPNGKHLVRGMMKISPTLQVGKQQALGGETQFESFKQTQQRLIRSRMLLKDVLTVPAVAKLPDIRTAEDPLRDLEDTIRVTWVSPELMEVSMNGNDPAQLKTILDALLDKYEKSSEGAERNIRGKTRALIETSISGLDKEIAVREKRLKDIASLKLGADSLTAAALFKSESEMLTKTAIARQEMQLQAKQFELKIKNADAKLAGIDAAPLDPDEVDAAIGKDPEFAERYAEVVAVRNRLEASRNVLRAGHPTILAEEEKLKQAKDTLRRLTADARPKFEKDARLRMRQAAAAARQALVDEATLNAGNIKAYTELEATLNERLGRIGVSGVNAGIDQDDLKPLKEQRAKLQGDLLDLNVWDKVEARIQKWEEATVILNQTLKQKVLLSVAALVAGTVALMLAVAFLEWRSRRIDSVDQVVSELGLRVIGTIPAFPTKQSLKSGDAATSQNWRFVLNESVNSARTMLLHTAKTQNMQVLMVTSAMQGEGKTSLASQLATSMATAGLRTLILDCDLRNPSMHKLFDAPLTPGCSEVLCQEIDVSDAVQPTTVPNLWLIPAGQCSNRVISALAQGHPLESLFNRLRGQFDFVVVDSCPVLPVADTLLVGQHVDGVVISILQDISQLPKVQLVSDRLTDLNIPVLGAVVNGIKPDIHAYGYNYVKQLPA